MSNYLHFISHDKINQSFESVLDKRNISAGLDRFTKQNLRKYEESESIEKYHSFLVNGYNPRKFIILRDPKIELSPEDGFLIGKMRIMCKPSVFDRPAFEILKNYLEAIYQSKSGKNYVPINFITNLVNQINKIYGNDNQEDYYMIKTDVSSFYSSIDQKILMRDLIDKYKLDDKAVLFIQNILEKYKESFSNLNSYNKTYTNVLEMISSTNFVFSIDYQKGIPQGLPVSNILAEMFIHNIEQSIKKELKKNRY